MDEASIAQYLTTTFEGVDVVVASGDSFFFFDPTHMMPFATLVMGDNHDTYSNLNRPSVFRLNIGVSKETFRSLFGTLAPDFDSNGDYDFAALDQIMPHPVYGKMNWLCVLSPSDATFEKLSPLLAEAYGLAVRRQKKSGTENNS